MTPASTLEEKFAQQLPFVYYSEHQFAEAQAKMAAHTTDATLKAGIEKHILETKQQAAVLENIFLALGRTPKEEKCPICDGFVQAGKTGLQEPNDALRDVSIAGIALMIEHEEVGRYRSLIDQAQAMGRQDIADQLQQILQQEENAASQIEQGSPALAQKAAASG